MKKQLENVLQRAIERAREGGRLKLDGVPPLSLEIPKDTRFGDVASTVALGLARVVRRPPREIAAAILEHIEDPEGFLDDVQIAGAGYLNFRFSPRFWRRCLLDTADPAFARPAIGRGERVLVEFVSANPTGPLHVGHGRGAVLGDAVARLLEAAGFAVTREYYVNDAGRQIELLGRSVLARLREALGAPLELPEEGYPGEDLAELAAVRKHDLVAEVAREAGLDPSSVSDPLRLLEREAERAAAACGRLAAEWLLDRIRADLEAVRVRFDSFVSERALREEGAVERVLAALDQRGLLYNKEGALWFRSTRFGDDKDRVVRRSDGELTYFACDIAYHAQKLERGFDRLVDVWGADHHGYVPRVKAAVRALGHDADRLRVLLVQIVRLTRGGQPVRMGKRSGELVTLREVVEEVGPDAARFFYLMRRGDSQLEFDLDLAKRQSAENPVFYVQYAHARICSLFRQAEAQGVSIPEEGLACLDALEEPEEMDVARQIAIFPDTVEEAVRELEPHRVLFQLIEIAASFHRFYNRHRILGVEPERTAARLYLALAVRRVLRGGLELLGVEAPETM